MILFSDDWDKYPTAIADVKTTNVSWVHTAALYESMGIKNCYFPLALIHPELQGVDPFSLTLTNEQKATIYYECKINPWYFFREILRLPPSVTSTRFRCNRGVISVLWSFFCGIDYSLIMPRQTGKSVTIDGLDVWLLIFGLNGHDIFLFTKDRELRKKNINRIKETISILPGWMNPTCSKDLDNTEVVTMVANSNLLKSAVGQAQKDRANNIGRGETITVIQVDEGPFIPNVHISIPVLLAAGGAARDNAKLANIPYGTIFTTTSGKKDTKEGKFMYNLIHSGMYWNESLFDCEDKRDVGLTVRTNSKRGLINGTFSHRQLGKTDEWLNEKILESGGTVDTINRDYYNKWTSGTESSPISTAIAEVLSSTEIPPLYMHMSKDRYMMRWYIPEADIAKVMASSDHIIGLDSSNAIGRDANAIVITGVRDMGVVACSDISEANLFVYAQWVAEFMIRYERTTLVIENKSSGQSIIDTVSAMLLAVGINPFKRIFNRVVDEHVSKESEFKEISTENFEALGTAFLRHKGSMGFMTTGNRRAFLYDTVLQDAVKSTGHLIKDASISNEIRSLVVKGDKVDHIEGGNDDMVISWLLCQWFVKYGKNLEFYGIDTRSCLSLVAPDGATISESDLHLRKELIVINLEIDDIKDKLVSAPTVVQSLRLERSLKTLVDRAKLCGDNTLIMNNIMDEVNNKKISKKSLTTAIKRFNYMKRAA